MEAVMNLLSTWNSPRRGLP